MKNKKLIALVLLPFLIVGCQNRDESTPINYEEDLSPAEVLSLNDGKLRLTQYGKIDREEIDPNDLEQMPWVDEDIKSGKEIYLVSYDIVYKNDPVKNIVNITLNDENGTKIGCKEYKVNYSPNETGKFYYSLDQGTVIDSINVEFSIGDQRTSEEFFLKAKPNLKDDNEDKEDEKSNEVINKITLAPEVNLLVHNHKFLQSESMDENEKSNLEQYLKDDSTNKIYMLEYSLNDNRDNKKLISKGQLSNVDDSFLVYVKSKNEDQLNPVSIYSDYNPDKGDYYYKEYYLIEDGDEILDIKVNSNIDGELKEGISLK